jgi:hypothetical protein
MVLQNLNWGDMVTMERLLAVLLLVLISGTKAVAIPQVLDTTLRVQSLAGEGTINDMDFSEKCDLFNLAAKGAVQVAMQKFGFPTLAATDRRINMIGDKEICTSYPGGVVNCHHEPVSYHYCDINFHLELNSFSEKYQFEYSRGNDEVSCAERTRAAGNIDQILLFYECSDLGGPKSPHAGSRYQALTLDHQG